MWNIWRMYGSHKRTPCRDAITLFDECGVIIAYTDDDIDGAFKQS